MKQYIFIIFAGICLALAPSCTDATASAPTQNQKAANVSISEKSVYIVHADAEFILKFNQHCTYEINGAAPVTVPAQVFQMDGGEWIAGWNSDNYVRVNPQTGITNAYINGRTYVGICGHMAEDVAPPAN